MAQGLFNAAARERISGKDLNSLQAKKSQSRDLLPSLFRSFSQFLGIADIAATDDALSSPQRKVSVGKDLTYDWLDNALNETKQHLWNDSTAHKSTVDAACSNLMTFALGTQNDGWVFIEESDGILVESFAALENSHPMIRGQIVIPFEPKHVMALILNPKFKSIVDPRAEEDRIVAKVDEQTIVSYRRYPGKLIVAGRDTVVLAHWRHFRENNTFALCLRGIEHADAPQAEGYIRVDVLGGGMIVETLPNQHSRLTIVSYNDIKLGAHITKQAAITQVKAIQRIRNALVP